MRVAEGAVMASRTGVSCVLLLLALASPACGGSVTNDVLTTDAGEASPILDSDRAEVVDTAINPPIEDAAIAVDAAATGVSCGAATCTSPSYCMICRPGDPTPAAACTTDMAVMCPSWGDRPPLRVSCDGHEDCAAAERCAVVEGSLGTYARCVSMPTTDCKVGMQILCRSLADCPPCAKSCAPYGGASYPIRSCQ